MIRNVEITMVTSNEKDLRATAIMAALDKVFKKEKYFVLIAIPENQFKNYANMIQGFILYELAFEKRIVKLEYFQRYFAFKFNNGSVIVISSFPNTMFHGARFNFIIFDKDSFSKKIADQDIYPCCYPYKNFKTLEKDPGIIYELHCCQESHVLRKYEVNFQ